MRQNIIIAGVGGQGILTIARVLSLAALHRGLHVKQAEVHGMSQRGGAVYSHLRISEGEIFSDLIPVGECDLILAIEPLEALRYAPMLGPGGTVVASTNAEANIPNYPPIEEVLTHIARFPNHIAIDTGKIARAAGGVLSANIVALGAASAHLRFTAAELEAAIEELFEPKGERVVQTNIRAFRFGRTAAAGYGDAVARGMAPTVVRDWLANLSPEHLASDELDFSQLETADAFGGLSAAEAHAAESLLMSAYEEGRRQLYEHEVYRLIELVGAISPPRHTFVPAGSTIAEDVLIQYPGDRVVVKLVSADVVHKSDVGAVAIIPKELPLVRAEIDSMVARHMEHARVAGTLVVEFVPHDARSLGSELFVGIRATREFGPVIAAGLGGLDTEYLASKLRRGAAVAKAVALDTSPEEFFEMFRETVAFDVLSGQARGHERSVSDGELLRCFRAFIAIARRFCIDRGEEGPDIGEIEVNPFAFAAQRLVPLDGRGRLLPATKTLVPRPREAVRRLLRPGSIAVAGVSSKPEGIGRLVVRNILRAGYDPSRLSIVKEGESEIEGVKCVPNLASVREPFDLLVVATPAEAVPGIVAEAVDGAKARAGILLSGGIGEVEGTERLGDRTRDAIARGRGRPNGGPVFLGPNCMGVRSAGGRYDTFFIPDDKLPPRGPKTDPVALISQSGAFAVARLSGLPHLNPALAVSLGNQVDVTLSDVLRALDEEPDIRVAGVYLEGFADMDGLETLRAVEEWTGAGKTIVFYKGGRTGTGRDAAAGHTAAIAGDYDICETALRHAGALVAGDFREFADLLEMATLFAQRPTLGRRVFAVTNAGMEAVGIADSAASLAPCAGEYAEGLRGRLAAHGLDRLVGVRNPLDLTPMAAEAAYDDVVRWALASDEVDAVLVSCVPLAPGLRTLAGQLDDPCAFPQVVAGWLATSRKPIAMVFDSGPEYNELRRRIREQGVPVFSSADEAARRLARWLERQAARLLLPSSGIPEPVGRV